MAAQSNYQVMFSLVNSSSEFNLRSANVGGIKDEHKTSAAPRKNESHTLQMRLKLVSYQLSLSKNKMIYANEEC
ncbi:hypothetical protein XBKQ1_1580030 [Xenorhabdus bovienii str. kraussei Quebec]|uniref:Uncharacterized protein n=1 Tax=Xenorhabdus bovienii str. kraussei Quebec TaxID=1398203 RepID=A0A077PCM5_XENBV|nr:hypothetical protein XBKQ1_1580030 [Xenorhabdus bovienii str. kraussei Quebec]